MGFALVKSYHVSRGSSSSFDWVSRHRTTVRHFDHAPAISSVKFSDFVNRKDFPVIAFDLAGRGINHHIALAVHQDKVAIAFLAVMVAVKHYHIDVCRITDFLDGLSAVADCWLGWQLGLARSC